jgi:hypothetical protein
MLLKKKKKKKKMAFVFPAIPDIFSKVSPISLLGWICVCHRKKSKFLRSKRKSIAAS